MNEPATCQRCRKPFDRADLRPVSLIMRLFAAPAFLFFMVHSGTLRREFVALYCRPCRRQLNFCFFFMAFCVVLFVTTWALQSLGILGAKAH
jgi:hypothetical protein